MDTQYPEEELSFETFSGAHTTFSIVNIKGPVRSEYGRLEEPGVSEKSEMAREKGGPPSVSQYSTKSGCHNPTPTRNEVGETT